MTEIVYVVTAGEYSAYRIVACFTTREAAEAAVEIYNRDEDVASFQAEVEEWPLLSEARRIEVHTYQDYDNPEYQPYAAAEVVWGDGEVEVVEDITSGIWGTGVRARAMTRERAQKTAQDRLAFLKAQQEGLT